MITKCQTASQHWLLIHNIVSHIPQQNLVCWGMFTLVIAKREYLVSQGETHPLYSLEMWLQHQLPRCKTPHDLHQSTYISISPSQKSSRRQLMVQGFRSKTSPQLVSNTRCADSRELQGGRVPRMQHNNKNKTRK